MSYQVFVLFEQLIESLKEAKQVFYKLPGWERGRNSANRSPVSRMAEVLEILDGVPETVSKLKQEVCSASVATTQGQLQPELKSN